MFGLSDDYQKDQKTIKELRNVIKFCKDYIVKDNPSELEKELTLKAEEERV